MLAGIDRETVSKLQNWTEEHYLSLIRESGVRKFSKETLMEILGKHSFGIENFFVLALIFIKRDLISEVIGLSPRKGMLRYISENLWREVA